MVTLLCSIILPNQACLVTGKDCSERQAVLTLKNSIFFYFFKASHLMGHDDKFLKNPLNCKGYLQNIEFDNLDCTFTQVSSVDKNVLCKKRNEKICL